MVSEIKTVEDFAVLLGVRRFWGNAWYFLIISILFGLLLGFIFRDYQDIHLFPVKLIWFALPAMAIGSVEELIFRGYIQRKLRDVGIVVSIVGASAMHTFYKCFIFIVLPSIHQTDYLWLSIWTFCIGCLLGVLKEYSANTMVAVSWHASFDLVVYGDGMVDSWWVWL
jgi:membrane protease YdiL (CAAX protease family)